MNSGEGGNSRSSCRTDSIVAETMGEPPLQFLFARMIWTAGNVDITGDRACFATRRAPRAPRAKKSPQEVEFLRASARPPRREGGIEADGDPACDGSRPASVRACVLGLLLALASLSFHLRGSRGLEVLGARDGAIQLDCFASGTVGIRLALGFGFRA